MSNTDTWKTREAICPYCGHEEMDTWEMYGDRDGDTDIYNCGSCDEKYEITTNIEVTVTTKRIACVDGKHEWEEPHRSDYILTRGQHWKGEKRGWADSKAEGQTEDSYSIWGRDCLHCQDMDTKKVGFKDPLPEGWKPKPVLVPEES